MPTTTHHHDDDAVFNTNFHAVNNSQPHANVASERIMSQSNSDIDPESTDEREEEHDIKHFSLDKRGDCIDNFMTYNIAGFKHRFLTKNSLNNRTTPASNSKLPQ